MLIQPMPITLPVRNPSQVKVTKVAAGRAHTLALTSENEARTCFPISYEKKNLKRHLLCNIQVYSLGNNAYGQCGRNIIEDEDFFNSRVIHKVKPDLEDGDMISDLVCGQDHR